MRYGPIDRPADVVKSDGGVADHNPYNGRARPGGEFADAQSVLVLWRSLWQPHVTKIMASIGPPWVEGEKIPAARLKDVYRPAPDVPPAFLRSTLIIGARGVGKTTLLRYHQSIHAGVTADISLATAFASLTKQSGRGPLTVDFPPALHDLIAGKAVALLALRILDRLAAVGIHPPRDAIARCLPSKFHRRTPEISAGRLDDFFNDVAAEPLKAFEGLADRRPLPALVTVLGNLAYARMGPLVLSLDRADMVVTPSLLPVFELLDQSEHFIAVMATRPGPAVPALAALGDAVVAGDHYDVVHLGTWPRSDAWIRFVETAVRAQFGRDYDNLAGRLKRLILTISRDSLRTALELAARGVRAKGRPPAVELASALEDLREKHFAAAQRTLQRYHPDFRSLVDRIRADLLRQHSQVTVPALLHVDRDLPSSLFAGESRVTRMIDSGLRCAAFCMREGERWVPGLQPNEVEVAPILLWKNDESFAVPPSVDARVVRFSERDLFRQPFGGRRRRPLLFVAYQMRVDRSLRFREELEETFSTYPGLRGFELRSPAKIK